MLILQLSINWSTNEQYAHGFLVPFLCLFLLIKSEPFIQLEESKKSFLQGNIWLIIGIPILLTLIPLWIIRGANSDWRLLNFILFSIVLIATLIPFYDQGGWERIKPLLFPFLFFLVAIPWPLATDLQLTQWFQERVSSIIVDILLLLEHEATLQGTVIDVGVFGQIGIDQACSGINGLQASLVVTLFLGAYYQFRWINRIVLVVSGSMVALCFNLVRAFSLSYVKVKGKGHLLEDALFSIGSLEMPSLHDLAGWIETSLIFITIFLLARSAKGGLFLRVLGNEPTNWKNLRSSPPLPYSLMIIMCVVFSFAFAELHYKTSEQDLISLPRLKLDLEDKTLLTEEKVISKQIAKQLHFEKAQSIQWQERLRTRISPYSQIPFINPNQEYWQAFEATWESGGVCTSILSTHSPDSCLPLTGLAQVNPLPGNKPIILPVKVGKIEILFETYEFSQNRQKLFVFRCFWPHRMAAGQRNLFPNGGYSLNGRIKAALEGRRNVGGTMLALALVDDITLEKAIIKLQALANQRLSFGEKEVQ
jgi:exosortase/archaeosortase family protein